MSNHLRLVDHSPLTHPAVAAASPSSPPDGPQGTPPESRPTIAAVSPVNVTPGERTTGAPPELARDRSPLDAVATEAGGGGSGGVPPAPSLPPYIIVTEVRGQRRWFKVVEVDCRRVVPRGPLVVAECHDRTSAERVCGALNARGVRAQDAIR